MKTTDWKWNGTLAGIQVRRHGDWYIGKPDRWFWFAHFKTTGQWRLIIGPLVLGWFPADRVRMAVKCWKFRR